MLVLVHASPTTLAPHRTPNLGVLCSPRRVYGHEMDGWPHAADNDAFSQWDSDRYGEMIDTLKARSEPPLWVSAPDVVGDAAATLDLFYDWARYIHPLPIAYVLQDGQQNYPVPWMAIRAVFVGGSSEFKMGDVAARYVREAQERGLKAHMGRVNSQRRLRYAKALGCDSVDGTSLSWFKGDGEPKRARDRDRLQRFLAHAAQPPQGLLS